jgi:hypothetical protein
MGRPPVFHFVQLKSRFLFRLLKPYSFDNTSLTPLSTILGQFFLSFLADTVCRPNSGKEKVC